MSGFDLIFLKIFQYFKAKKNKKTNAIAVAYIALLQISLLFLLGVFTAIFLKQMHVELMTPFKAWTLFVLCAIAIYFKNWIKYNGKKRKVLNAKALKHKTLGYSVWMLWLLPIACIALALVLLKGF